MAKIKKYLEEDCTFVLFPLGKSVPLCSYKILKEHRMTEARLNDFPMCDKKHCPKSKNVKD